MVNFKKNKDSQKFLGFEYNYPLSTYTPDDAAKGLLLFIIIQTIISVVYQATYFMGFGKAEWVSYFFTTLLDAAFVFVAFKLSNSKGDNFAENVKLNKKPTLAHLFLAIGMSLICIFGFSGITNVFLQLLYNAGYVSTTSDIVVNNFGIYLVYVVFVCILPALCEEIMFRGLIFNGLKKISTPVAVFGSAFLFMLMHGTPDQTIHQFILGIILAISLLLTNSIWVPIFIHFFNNFIAVTYSYIVYGDSASNGAEAVEVYLGQYIIYALVTAFVACCLAYLIFRTFVRIRQKQELEKAEKTFNEPNFILQGEFANENSETINGEGEQTIYREQLSSMTNTPHLTKQGKIILIISVVWMVTDWIYALIVGFGGMVY